MAKSGELELLFRGAHLKIIRARELIGELIELRKSMLRGGTAKAVLCEEGGHLHWRITTDIKAPVKLPLLVGDAIHNMRSSLDHAAVAAARSNKRSGSNTYFPFASFEGDLSKQISKKELTKCSHEVVEYVRSLKPYKGGNRLLRALHDLDVSDKHHGLTVVASASLTPPLGLDFEQNRARVKYNTGEEVILPFSVRFPVPIKEGYKSPPMIASDMSKVGSSFLLSPDFFIFDGPFKFDMCIPTLEELHGVAKSVVEGIAKIAIAAAADRN